MVSLAHEEILVVPIGSSCHTPQGIGEILDKAKAHPGTLIGSPDAPLAFLVSKPPLAAFVPASSQAQGSRG